jgi:hypothetical protein
MGTSGAKALNAEALNGPTEVGPSLNAPLLCHKYTSMTVRYRNVAARLEAPSAAQDGKGSAKLVVARLSWPNLAGK